MTHPRIQGLEDLSGCIRMLWHDDDYDQPLSGYAQLDGEPGYWFELLDEHHTLGRWLHRC